MVESQIPSSEPPGGDALSSRALRVLGLFRARGRQLAGCGLLWSVIAASSIVQEDKQAGLQELTTRGLVQLHRGHRYVLTPAGEACLREVTP